LFNPTGTVLHRNLAQFYPDVDTPSSFFYPAFLGDAHAHFKGPITVGEDGMLFMLPTGSSVIEKRKLF